MFEKFKAIAGVTVKEIKTQYNLGEKISKANDTIGTIRNKIARGLNALADEVKSTKPTEIVNGSDL